MATRYIEAVLRFRDQFTGGMNTATKKLEANASTIKKTGKSIERTGKSISGVGKSLTSHLTVPILATGVACFKLASDAQETEDKIRQVFGNSTYIIDDSAKTSLEKFGLSGDSAKEMAGNYGDLATSIGISDKASANMSARLVGLAGDMASFKNVSIETASNALTGVFTGQTRALKSMGVVMSKSALEEYAQSRGIKTKYTAMTEAQKVQLRYNYVLEKTSKSQGDFLRTGGKSANQMRTFTEGVKELGASFGNVLIPVLTPVIHKANEFLKSLQKMPDSQKKMVVHLLAVLAVIGPVVLMVGKLTTGIGHLIWSVGNISAKLGKAGGLMKLILSPAGKVVIAIVAIGIAIALVIKYWDKIKKAITSFKNTVVKMMKDAGFPVDEYAKKIKAFGAGASKVFHVIWIVFKAIYNFMKPIIKVIVIDWINLIIFRMRLVVGVASAVFKSIVDYISGVKRTLSGIIKFIKGVFTGDWKMAWQGVKDIFGGIFQQLGALVKAPMNAVISVINGAIAGINKLHIKIPKWVPKFGGDTLGFHIGTIPMLAKGTPYFTGGSAIVGESGAELINLPRGARVTPARETKRQLATTSKSIVVNKLANTIIVREEADIDKIATKLADKLELIEADIA